MTTSSLAIHSDQEERQQLAIGWEIALNTTDLGKYWVRRLLGEMTESFPVSASGEVGLLWLAERLGRIKEWCWPLLTEWSGRFDEIDALPYMWKRTAEHAWAQQRVLLLEHWLMACGYRHRSLARIQPGWMIAFGAPIKGEAQAIVDLEHELICSFLEGRLEHLPPFYPGSRIGCQLMPADHFASIAQRRTPSGMWGVVPPAMLAAAERVRAALDAAGG